MIYLVYWLCSWLCTCFPKPLRLPWWCFWNVTLPGWSHGRGAHVAAVALVVGARQEPIGALRLLSEQDPSLRRLPALTRRLAAGFPLSTALFMVGLLTRGEAAALAKADPATLAVGLGHLAAQSAAPSWPRILRRWFPVWICAAILMPTLVLAVVRCLGETMTILSLGQDPDLTLTSTVIFSAATLVAVAGLWFGLGKIPVMRAVTWLTPAAEREMLLGDLLAWAQANAPYGVWKTKLSRWMIFSRPRHAASIENMAQEERLDNLLVGLGVVVPTRDGRPDWTATREQQLRDQDDAEQSMYPYNMAMLIVAIIIGGVFAVKSVFEPLWYALTYSGYNEASFEFLIAGAMYSGVAVLLAWLWIGLSTACGWLIGPARDWPRVAARLVVAMERRQDLVTWAQGVGVAVAWPMRRALRRFAESSDPHLCQRLVDSGMVPLRQRGLIGRADPRDVPSILTTVSPPGPVDRGWLVGIMVMGVLAMFWSYAERFYQSFPHDMYYPESPGIDLWLDLIFYGLPILLLGVISLTIIGRRFGWGLTGWARRARGRVLLEAWSARQGTVEIAQRLAALMPRRRLALTSAGAAGDWPTLARLCGFRVQDQRGLMACLAGLERAVQRRRVVLRGALRLMIPFAMAVPVILIGIKSTNLTYYPYRILQNDIAHGPPAHGGSIHHMIIWHWVAWCEAETQRRLERTR